MKIKNKYKIDKIINIKAFFKVKNLVGLVGLSIFSFVFYP